MTPVGVFTTVVNRPDFLEYQARLFRKYLRDEYVFHVVDDSVEPAITRQYAEICRRHGLEYHRKPRRFRLRRPSAADACAEAVQWTYDALIRSRYADSVALLLDSDMFLVEDFDPRAYVADHTLAGLKQRRGPVVYLANCLLLLNMPEIERLGGDLDFSPGKIEGQDVDVGGHLYYFIHRPDVRVRETDPDMRPAYPTHFKGIWLQDPALTEGYNIEAHCGGRFLHYRAASNWFRECRSTADPLAGKTRIVERMLADRL